MEEKEMQLSASYRYSATRQTGPRRRAYWRRLAAGSWQLRSVSSWRVASGGCASRHTISQIPAFALSTANGQGGRGNLKLLLR